MTIKAKREALKEFATKVDTRVAQDWLYTLWAVKHLLVLQDCHNRISRQSNMNMLDAQVALENEICKLINENPNYREATSFIQEIQEYLVEEVKEVWCWNHQLKNER